MSRLKTEVNAQDHAQGPDDAPVTLVEYGDYECPHCAHAQPVVKKLEEHYGDKLRFVFRHFPLTQIHQNAQAAAEVAEFAASQGKFWEMHGLLFGNQEQLGSDLFPKLTGQLGLDSSRMRQDLESGTFTEKVRSDFTGGIRSGVNGTPTFFIDGNRHNGPADFESLSRAIDEATAQS